jgi:hypothetical protein
MTAFTGSFSALGVYKASKMELFSAGVILFGKISQEGMNECKRLQEF